METVVFADNRSAHVTPGVIAPRFGQSCVCCGVATSRTQLYDPSTKRIQCEAISVPVCAPCRGHAMVTPFATMVLGSAVLIGVTLGGIGIARAGADARTLIAIGAALVVAAVSWMVALSVRTRRWRRAGHHPSLTMDVTSGRCELRTTNVELVNELVATNRFARRRPGHGGRGHVPTARVVSSTAAPDPDALTPEEKSRLLAEALAPRPPAASNRRDSSR